MSWIAIRGFSRGNTASVDSHPHQRSFRGRIKISQTKTTFQKFPAQPFSQSPPYINTLQLTPTTYNTVTLTISAHSILLLPTRISLCVPNGSYEANSKKVHRRKSSKEAARHQGSTQVRSGDGRREEAPPFQAGDSGSEGVSGVSHI